MEKISKKSLILKVILGLTIMNLVGFVTISNVYAQENPEEIPMDEAVYVEDPLITSEFLFDEEAEAMMQSIVEENKQNSSETIVQILFINDDGSRILCSYGPYHDYCQSMNGDLPLDDYSNLSIMPMSEYATHVPPVEMIEGGFSETVNNDLAENDEGGSGILEGNYNGGGTTGGTTSASPPPMCTDACITINYTTSVYSTDPHTIMVAVMNALEKVSTDLGKARLDSAKKCWGKGCGWKGTTTNYDVSVEPYTIIPFTCSLLEKCEPYSVKEKFTISAFDWKSGVNSGKYKPKGGTKPDPDYPDCYYLDSMVCEKKVSPLLLSQWQDLCTKKDPGCWGKIEAKNPYMHCWNEPNKDLGIECGASGKICCTNTPNPVNVATASINVTGKSCYRCSDDPDFVFRYRHDNRASDN